jgi:hypothetical protein
MIGIGVECGRWWLVDGGWWGVLFVVVGLGEVFAVMRDIK